MIAQRPCEPRDAARLLLLDRRSGRIEHHHVRDLLALLRRGDCLVLNTTRVLPAKFVARRGTGGRLSGLFLRESGPGRWDVVLNGAGRLRPGERLRLGDSNWSMRLLRRHERGRCEVRVEPVAPAGAILDEIGAAPLPPYIRRGADDAAGRDVSDRTAYQTVYAAVPGAVAAPTAGLHLTHGLLEEIRAGGVSLADVVLHVGLGTFQPIEVEDLADHVMHREWFELTEESARIIRAARSGGGRAIAVGSTSVRVLETCAREGDLHAGRGWTDILIYPPYSFRATDAMLTNFHLPGSTLLALVAAFAGLDRILRAYRVAIEKRYRFYSYGDAMLIV